MIRRFALLAPIGALCIWASPAMAEKVFDTQVGKFDLDPFNILAPAAPPEPAAADKPAPKKKHHAKRHKKKM